MQDDYGLIFIDFYVDGYGFVYFGGLSIAHLFQLVSYHPRRHIFHCSQSRDQEVLLNLAAIANRESFFSISPVFRFWKEYVWITIATVCLIAPVIDGSFRLSFGIR